MATMDDIAKRLGITKGTVSKALSGASDVSEAMRKAVLEAAVEMGYSRIVRTKEVPRICIFIENMEYRQPEDFGWDLVIGFRKMAEPAGFAVDIIPLDINMQKQMSYDEYMLMNSYKGAFFLGVSFQDPWMNDFKTCRTPAVLFDNKSQYNPVITQIGIDNDEGLDRAISQLKKLGHEKVGYLSGGLGSFVYQERYMAFFHALRKNNLDDNRNLAGHAYFASDCLSQHFPRLRQLGCTAIVCSHDLLAHALLIHCNEKGIRVPEELSIMGIDDLPLCRFTSPPLASIRQDRTELGKSAFYALSSQVNQIHINTVKLHPELVFRGSVGKAPAGTAV